MPHVLFRATVRSVAVTLDILETPSLHVTALLQLLHHQEILVIQIHVESMLMLLYEATHVPVLADGNILVILTLAVDLSVW
jgi:hypothetical protein